MCSFFIEQLRVYLREMIKKERKEKNKRANIGLKWVKETITKYTRNNYGTWQLKISLKLSFKTQSFVIKLKKNFFARISNDKAFKTTFRNKMMQLLLQLLHNLFGTWVLYSSKALSCLQSFLVFLSLTLNK